MTRPLGHWLLLLALVAMWGSAFMLTGIAVRGFSPTALVTIRLVIAAVLLTGSGRSCAADVSRAPAASGCSASPRARRQLRAVLADQLRPAADRQRPRRHSDGHHAAHHHGARALLRPRRAAERDQSYRLHGRLRWPRDADRPGRARWSCAGQGTEFLLSVGGSRRRRLLRHQRHCRAPPAAGRPAGRRRRRDAGGQRDHAADRRAPASVRADRRRRPCRSRLCSRSASSPPRSPPWCS